MLYMYMQISIHLHLYIFTVWPKQYIWCSAVPFPKLPCVHRRSQHISLTTNTPTHIFSITSQKCSVNQQKGSKKTYHRKQMSLQNNFTAVLRIWDVNRMHLSIIFSLCDIIRHHGDRFQQHCCAQMAWWELSVCVFCVTHSAHD